MYSAFEKETLKKKHIPYVLLHKPKKIGIYDAIFLSNM